MSLVVYSLTSSRGVRSAFRGVVPQASEAPCELTALRELDLANNRIGGPLPAWVSQCDALERIRLYNNSFLYPHDDESAQRAVERAGRPLETTFERCVELLAVLFSHFPLYFLLPPSYFRVPTSAFLLPTSDFRVPTSCVLLPAADFLLPTSYFRVPTSEFLLHTSDF